MEESSDRAKLIDYQQEPSTARKRERRSRSRQRNNGELEDNGWSDEAQQMATFSDSESGVISRDRKGPRFQETAVYSGLSDDLSDSESLPSTRAALAASMKHKETKMIDLEKKENTPLLMDNSVPGKGKEDSEESLTTYSTLTQSGSGKRPSCIKRWYNHIKVASITLFVVGCVVLFAVNDEELDESRYHYFVRLDPLQQDPSYSTLIFSEEDTKTWKFVRVEIEGPFQDLPYDSDFNENLTCSDYVFVCGDEEERDLTCQEMENNTHCESFKVNPDTPYKSSVEKTLELQEHGNTSYMSFLTQHAEKIEFQITVHGEILEEYLQVVLAAIILVGVYVLIGFDIVHRTLAAMIGSTCTLGVLSMLQKRPSLHHVVQWIDLDTVSLLFGMMTLVGIFSQTGFFDYSAVKAYKLARGKIWPLITLLCFFSAIVSAFLDNVTTILLLVPVSIRLCQVLNLDPRPVLIAEVVFSNIGGTATAIGDPPNVIIVSNTLIKNDPVNINFSEFTLHLFIGIIFCTILGYGLLSLSYGFSYMRLKNKDPPHISELKREIAIWERTAQRLNIVSLEERAVQEALLHKAAAVRNQLSREVNMTMQSAQDLWQKNLAELESKYRITNRVLLVKSAVVLTVVILLFFLSNIIPSFHLDLGWIAIFGGVVLLLLSDIQDLEAILHKIEWGTLLFFAALFVLMEGLAELGLIKFIGNIMVIVVEKVPIEHQMTVAILMVLWISALASSFIDNIPFTTATIPVIVELAFSSKVCLSIRPLVWALAFGACLGGNGTLIGASANVVCAGIAEQNGYKISFGRFFKLGFPMMLVTTFGAMIYLLICHSALNWNTSEAKECIANSANLF